MKKIAFEPHLYSINKAYRDYFKNNKEIDFRVLNKPRWKDKTNFKIFKIIIYMIKSFIDFAIGRYDLVHINGANFGIVAYLASFFKCKYIFTMHSAVDKDLKDGKKFLRKITNILRPIIAKRAKKTFTISNFAKKELESFYKIKVNVIYNGISEDYINDYKKYIKIKKRSKKVFISVGRMTPIKNPFKVIDVFEKCKNIYGNAFLIFIGDGSLFNDVKKYVYNKNLEKDVIFIRKVPFEEMKKWYTKADYFISACEMEGFGLSALEAVACGCIPIVPKSGAFPEIFIKDRYLYNINEIENIKIFEPTEEDRAFLLEILEKYTWEKNITQYELEYKNL